MTNADCIRRMSDEQLYEFLSEWECGDIDYAITFCDLCKQSGNKLNLDCDGCRKHWLQRDAVDVGGLMYWKRNTTFEADTPQTEQKEDPVGCSRDWSVSCTFCDRYFSCDYLSGKQTESTGSPIGDYRDGVGAWQTDCDDRYAVRTDSGEVVAYSCPLSCEQTDCAWKEPNE